MVEHRHGPRGIIGLKSTLQLQRERSLDQLRHPAIPTGGYPAKIAGLWVPETLASTKALPSAAIAPSYTSPSESVSVNVPSVATV